MADLLNSIRNLWQTSPQPASQPAEPSKEQIQKVQNLFRKVIVFPKVDSSLEIGEAELLKRQNAANLEKIGKVVCSFPGGDFVMDAIEQKSPDITDVNLLVIKQWIVDQNFLLTLEKLPIPEEVMKTVKTIPDVFNKAAYLRKWIEENKETLKDIKELNFCNLHLTLIPLEIFCYFPHLISLDVSFNKIEEIPPEIQRLTQLQNLYAHNNRMKTLPNELKTLSMLKELCVPNNDISELPQGLTDLKNLEILDLEGNELKTLPAGLTKLPHLKSLKVDYNPDLKTE